jgi:hypothetical protein
MLPEKILSSPLPLLPRRTLPPKPTPEQRLYIQEKNKEIDTQNRIIEEQNRVIAVENRQMEAENVRIREYNRRVLEQVADTQRMRRAEFEREEEQKKEQKKREKDEKKRESYARKRQVEADKKRLEERTAEINRIGVEWIEIQKQIKKLFSKQKVSAGSSDFHLDMDLHTSQDIADFKLSLAKDLYKYIKMQIEVKMKTIEQKLTDPKTIEYHQLQKEVVLKRAEMVRDELVAELKEAEKDHARGINIDAKLDAIEDKKKAILMNIESVKKQRDIWSNVVLQGQKEYDLLRMKAQKFYSKITKLLSSIPEKREEWETFTKKI